MGLVIKAANEGKFITQMEIYPLLKYGSSVTYGAIRKSIAALEAQGMLERVPNNIGPNNVGRDLVPTLRGYDWFRPAR
jgi:hypothetical protein